MLAAQGFKGMENKRNIIYVMLKRMENIQNIMSCLLFLIGYIIMCNSERNLILCTFVVI